MNVIDSSVAIIGGGLTGLFLGRELERMGLSVAIIEARDRLGGRIFTHRKANRASIELGATWIGSQHTFLNSLLGELNLETFEQKLGDQAIYEYMSTSPHQLVSLPPNEAPSFRIKGGTGALIEKLAGYISKGSIYLNEKIHSISESGDGMVIEGDKNTFSSAVVVSTLPPYLLQATIDVKPRLPSSLTSILEQTHTWMGESIKVGLRFEKPFWREKGTSGTMFSNVGPVTELYDHSDHSNQYFALKGFFNGSYFPLKKEERLAMFLRQLQKYYGSVVDSFVDYEEAVWRNEPFTFAPYQGQIYPHQNNGHTLFQEPYINGKLFIAGSETSDTHGGYMEGAIRSAYRIIEQIRLA